jgi:predicted nucleic acid-binding protein
MRRVFADAWFYIALLDPHDAGHHSALAACTDDSLAGMVTTRWVLMEVANMLAGSKARTQCAAFLRELSSAPDTQIIPDSPDLFMRGLRLYEERPDKAWSLTDCISFLVMSEQGLTEALTGDHHFEQAGFTTLFG